LWHNLAEHTVKAVARHRSCLKQITAARPRDTVAGPEPAAATAAAPESRLETRMRDQHATVQALAARGLGIRAIARELGADRKTARRFVQALTADDAVARAISRPTILDHYQPHLHRRWAEGCHDAAVLHAEITELGYRGSLRTVYRYLQPLRDGTACGCRKLCHVTRPGHIRGSGRRAGPAAERAYSSLPRVDASARQADSAAAFGAAGGRCSDRRTRRGPAAGAVRR
jgi:hypothetical protein